ncbi:MAG: HAD family hydrolase [Eubacteriales bacterium]
MKDYKYILFDLDGTLTDSAEGITNSVAYALKRWNIEVADKSKLNCFVGPPLHASFEKYFGFSEEQALEAVDEYRVYYADRGIFENRVYDGIPELLAELCARGKKLVLATSKPEGYAKQIVEHFGLAKYFDLIAGATMDSSRTKKSLVIKYALGELGVTDPAECIMVGDRDQDTVGARENGIECIGVLYGYGDLAELTAANTRYIAETVPDILKFI